MAKDPRHNNISPLPLYDFDKEEHPMKKLVSLVLSLCLLLSLCAFSAAEELPTLEVYMYGDDLPDTQKVGDAISEITAEKIGCRIHLNVVKEFQKNMPLTMASNEQVDLVCDAASWNYWTFAKEGAYLDITDMLQTVTPNLYATLTSNMLEAAKVNGKIYGVPNYKDMSYQGGLWLEKKLADEQNIDLDKVYTLEEIEPWLEALHNDPDHVNSTLMLFGTNFNFPKMAMNQYFSYVSQVDGFGVGIRRSEPDKIVNIYASQEYADYCKLMYSWYEKGYIVADVATRDSWGSYYTNGSGVGYGIKVGQYVPLGEVSNSTAYGGDIVFVKIGECHASASDILGATWCVASKSQYPEQALKFIELLDTDYQVQNLLAFGIEGEHYTLEDGKVKLADNYTERYASRTYLTGDLRVRALMVGESDDRNALYEAFNNEAALEPNTGFLPDTEAISGQIAASVNVINEYGKLLGNGAVDPDTYLPMFLSALEEAGFNEVINEIQAQYDAFLAKK